MAATSPDLVHLVERFGYGLVALAVGLESVGVPFPGETTLVVAAIYAGTTHDFSITGVIAAAAAGAIVGDNIGFGIGRTFGHRMLLRHGGLVGMTEPRIKLGQYLFLRHGGKVVFFGRFAAVLRTLAAVLAGANRMTWPRFLVFNAAGGIIWTMAYGAGAFYLGENVRKVLGPVGMTALAAVAALSILGFLVLRRHEKRLQEEAERAFPGPLA